jgi:hypothetical protein
MSKPKPVLLGVTLEEDDEEAAKKDPIITPERATQESGLWYVRQEGLLRAGDARFNSPYMTGKAQVRQVRDVLKVWQRGVNVLITRLSVTGMALLLGLDSGSWCLRMS